MNIITRPWTVWRGWVNKDHTGHHSMFNSVFKQQDKYWEMSEYWIFKKILVAYRNWIFDMVRKNLRTCDKGKEKKKANFQTCSLPFRLPTSTFWYFGKRGFFYAFSPFVSMKTDSLKNSSQDKDFQKLRFSIYVANKKGYCQRCVPTSSLLTLDCALCWLLIYSRFKCFWGEVVPGFHSLLFEVLFGRDA